VRRNLVAGTAFGVLLFIDQVVQLKVTAGNQPLALAIKWASACLGARGGAGATYHCARSLRRPDRAGGRDRLWMDRCVGRTPVGAGPRAQASDSMKVSLLINNYNYAPFVGNAIESALAQDYRAAKSSWSMTARPTIRGTLIQSFGDCIRAVRQPNRGQGAAYNQLWSWRRVTTFCSSTADDRLDSNAISACIEAQTEDTASVQFRLRLMDEPEPSCLVRCRT